MAVAHALGFSPISDHDQLGGLGADDHLQYALLAGRAAGQQLIGGTGAADTLTLRGTSNAALGTINFDSPILIDTDVVTQQSTPASAWTLNASYTISTIGYLASAIRSAQTITVTGLAVSGQLFYDNTTYLCGVGPFLNSSASFWAETTVRNNGNFNLFPALGLVWRSRLLRNTAGTSTAANSRGYLASPAYEASALTATLTVTDGDALYYQPRLITGDATATVTLQNLAAVRVDAPTSSGAGTMAIDALYGIDVAAFGAVVPTNAAVVRSSLAAAANHWLIQNVGGADSDFGAGDIGFSDGAGITFGTGDDVHVSWNNTAQAIEIDPATGNSVTFASAAGGAVTLNSLTDGSYLGIASFFRRVVIGSTVAPGASSVQIVPVQGATLSAGDWSDLLVSRNVTPALTIDHAITTLATARINGDTPTIGTGAVTTSATLYVPDHIVAGTNRYGVLIAANPSGGGGENEALRVSVGRTRVEDFLHEGNLGLYGATPVAQAAAYTVTNPVTRRSFDTTTVTLQQLAEVVGTILGDDQNVGLRA